MFKPSFPILLQTSESSDSPKLSPSTVSMQLSFLYISYFQKFVSLYRHYKSILFCELSKYPTVFRHIYIYIYIYTYSASHSRVAPENVGLQKEEKYNIFACHTCNEKRLCVLEIRRKEVGNTKR
jgi:hypothetical protein